MSNASISASGSAIPRGSQKSCSSELVKRSDSTASTLDLKAITDVQLTVIDPSMGYGFVVHGLSLR